MSGENEVATDAGPERSGLDAKEATSSEPTGDPTTATSTAVESTEAAAAPDEPSQPAAATDPEPTPTSDDPEPADQPAEASPEPAPPATQQPVDDNTSKVQETPKPDPPAADTKSSDTAASDESKPVAIVASSKKSRPPYKYDPDKITLRFLFANRDGLTVTVECKPGDTVGEVKGALLSVWPDDLPDCEGGELLRLVCMGRGFLMPDTRTLEDCQIPVFKTHPTPVNVSVKPGLKGPGADSTSKTGGTAGGDGLSNSASNGAQQTSQGCACTIL